LLKKSQLNHNVTTDYIPPCPQWKEVEVKVGEESDDLEYASDGKYNIVPGTGEVVVRELVPIKQDLEGGRIPQDVQEACGCRLLDHPVIISDNEVTVAENVIPVRIQVECLSPADCVVSPPPCIGSLKPSHITGIPAHLESHYTMAKAIKRKC